MQPGDDIAQLRAAITAIEAQRTVLGDAVVEPALDSMRRQLASLESVGRAEQQRKQATVLFADIVGFTAMSESMDPENVTELVNDLWTRLDHVVAARGGHIDKHIGDAVMVLWGVGEAREDDAERAVRASLDMQAEVIAFSEQLHGQRRLPPDIDLQLRVGINTGPVLLGRVGLTREFTAMGDTVNLANRLEQLAPLGGVLAAHNTYRYIRGLFDTQPLGPIQVRGRAELVPVYVILRAKPRAFRVSTRGVEGVETRMIGRDAELIALQSAFTRVISTAETRVITVIGDAGVGKSRLLYEFDNWVELRPERVRYFKGRATPALQGVPFSLWRDLLAFRFDILDSDSPAVALSKFRKGMNSAPARRPTDSPNEAGSESRTAGHLSDIVGHWLGFDFSASPTVKRLANSPDFAALAQAYFIRFVRALAGERGMAVLLEDVHWADDSSLDLVGRLVTAAPDVHLLIICLTRPSLFERRPNWGSDLAGHHAIRLAPLDDAASRALVDEIMQRADDVPDALRDRVVAGAEGNPFYIEELVKMLLEQGVIVRGGQGAHERWRVASEKLADVRVPPSLSGLLQARLDALPRAEREVMQRAAVVGRTFWDEAVVALAHGDEPVPAERESLRPLLEALARRSLILRHDRSAFAGTEEYTFKHNLLREVTYETVLLRARREHHARVARWLELNAGGRLGEYLGLIAEHYALAGANNRAAAYLERAGDTAHRSGAYHSARDAFERALALRQNEEPAPLAVLSDLRLKLGAVYWNLGDFPAAERALYFARDHARHAGDVRGQATALYWLSRVAISRGDYAQARMLLAYGLPLARAADTGTLAQVLYGVADVAWKLGDLETVQTYVSDSLTLARALDNTTLELMALNRLGTVAYVRGDLNTAHSYYHTCLELARSTGNLEREATALMNLGALAHHQGDPAGGLLYYREALGHYREIGRSEQVVMALGNLAEAQVDQGDLAGARRDLREGLALARLLGLVPRVTVILFVYGRLLAAEGRREDAAAVLRLIHSHPATESQTRPQVVAALAGWGQTLDGPVADLEAVVSRALEEDRDVPLSAPS